MPWDNGVNKNAVIYAAHTTLGVRNMPLTTIRRSANLRVVPLCRFPNRQTSQEWRIHLFRPYQYALKFRDAPVKKYSKQSR